MNNYEYSKEILDHLLNPRNVGKIENHNGYGMAGDPECGDYLEVTILVENDFIIDIKYLVHGCVGAISTSSVASELVKGKHIMKAFTIYNEEVLEVLKDLPLEKVHCSLLGPLAIKKAILDYIKNSRQ